MHEHNHSHGHSHTHDVSELSGKKIFFVTVLNVVITVAEIIGGLLSGSLALLSDSMHNLSDTIAVALSYFANRISRKPKNPGKTFGYKRVEILAAFINSAALLMVSFWLIFEAYKRFKNPEAIDSTLMLIVAVIGLLANLVSVFLLEKDSHGNMNIKSSYLHLISDTVSSIGVILGGIAIKIWGITWIDPLITLFISLYIIKETFNILRVSINIFLQGAPDLDYEGIKHDIESISSVKNIHHVHAWMINEKTIHFEAHIDCEDMMLSEIEGIYDKVGSILKEKYKIEHITLQPEIDKCCNKKMFN